MLEKYEQPHLLIENLVIERMNQSDIFDVKVLEAEANLSTWSIEGYECELNHPDSICLVARVENNIVNSIVGFIIARLIITDYSCEIYNIAVDKNYRRSKIGSKLLTHLHKLCIKFSLEEIQLEVRPSNQSAIIFYKKFGYKFSYTRKNFYNNPVEDGFVMINKLR